MNKIAENNWTGKTVQSMVVETLVTYYVDLAEVDWNECYVEVAVTNPDADYRLEAITYDEVNVLWSYTYTEINKVTQGASAYIKHRSKTPTWTENVTMIVPLPMFEKTFILTPAVEAQLSMAKYSAILG